jgi:xylose isomerase
VAYAIANGVFGSIDANRGDYQNGWDTDQFSNSVRSLAASTILRGGGFTTGFQLRRQARRQSMARDDLFHAHIGGIDTRRALLVAAEMLEAGLDAAREARYSGWATPLGTSILGGETSLESLADRVAAGEIDPRPVSGRQEMLEGLVNQHIWAVDRGETA